MQHKRMTAGMLVTALGLASGSALADKTIAEFDGGRISIFGIIDVGLLYQGKAGDDGDKATMETSGLRQTVLGFKGDRDMGGGITAFFNLESHFDTNTGQLHGTGDVRDGDGNYSVPQWRRQANIGIRGDFGSLTVGRQYGPALLAHIGTEPRAFKEQFSNLYAWAYNQLLTTWDFGSGDRNTNNDVGIFFSNAIQYRNTLGLVDFGILYALGGQERSMEKNSAFAVGAAYNGPLVLSASYQVIKDDTTANENVKHWGLGAAVPMGTFTFKANYLRGKNESYAGVRQSDVAATGVGMDWRWSERNSATLAYYYNRDRENRGDKTRNVVISNDFAWKPDTTLYVQAALVDASDASTIRTSIVAAGVPSVGNRSFLINAGISFSF